MSVPSMRWTTARSAPKRAIAALRDVPLWHDQCLPLGLEDTSIVCWDQGQNNWSLIFHSYSHSAKRLFRTPIQLAFRTAIYVCKNKRAKPATE